MVSKRLILDELYMFPTVDKKGRLCFFYSPKYCCNFPGSFIPYRSDSVDIDVPVGFYIDSFGKPSVFGIIERRLGSDELFFTLVLSSMRYEM